jgi:hypothetical protein
VGGTPKTPDRGLRPRSTPLVVGVEVVGTPNPRQVRTTAPPWLYGRQGEKLRTPLIPSRGGSILAHGNRERIAVLIDAVMGL